jgi:hypothetical protein
MQLSALRLIRSDYQQFHVATKSVTITRNVARKNAPTCVSRASFEPAVELGDPALLPAVAGVCMAEDDVITACDPVDELMMPEGRDSVLSFVPPVIHAESSAVLVVSSEEVQPYQNVTHDSKWWIVGMLLGTDQWVQDVAIHLCDVDTIKGALGIASCRRVLVTERTLLDACSWRVAEEADDVRHISHGLIDMDTHSSLQLPGIGHPSMQRKITLLARLSAPSQ